MSLARTAATSAGGPSNSTSATAPRPIANRASSTGAPVTITCGDPRRTSREANSPCPGHCSRTPSGRPRSVTRASTCSRAHTACCTSSPRAAGGAVAGAPHVLVVHQVLQQVRLLAHRRQRPQPRGRHRADHLAPARAALDRVDQFLVRRGRGEVVDGALGAPGRPGQRDETARIEDRALAQHEVRRELRRGPLAAQRAGGRVAAA